MSYEVKGVSAVDIRKGWEFAERKWELAERLAGHNTLPEDMLKELFEGAMNALEKRANAKFDEPMKERVWLSVSKDRLKRLKDTFISEVSKKILGSFEKESDVEAMLEEHKQNGMIRNPVYTAQIQTAFWFNRDDVRFAVRQKTGLMDEVLIPDLVEALKKEGIQFKE